jgi:hypothetical protein
MQRFPLPSAWAALALFLGGLAALPAGAQDEPPAFAVRTASGKTLRGGPLRVAPGWAVRLGKGERVEGEDVLSVRQEGLSLPALPTDEHLILVNGDRFPVTGLRLKGERLYFHHPDLEGGKEASVPLTAVAVFWRMASDRTVSPEKVRRQLASGARTRDAVLLRNGDVLGGSLERLDGKEVEVEFEKKRSTAKFAQVAAVALSTDLADRSRPKGLHARLVLAKSGRSPGGRGRKYN